LPDLDAGPDAIRPATPADLPGLVALERGAFSGDRLSARALARLLAAPTAALLVAGREGAPRAAALVLFRAGSEVGRLYSIAVSASSRGAGLGSRLLAACEAEAAARGRRRMRLEVRADNAAARRLYERSGYRAIGLRPAYYEDGAAALRFEKPLGPAA